MYCGTGDDENEMNKDNLKTKKKKDIREEKKEKASNFYLAKVDHQIVSKKLSKKRKKKGVA